MSINKGRLMKKQDCPTKTQTNTLTMTTSSHVLKNMWKAALCMVLQCHAMLSDYAKQGAEDPRGGNWGWEVAAGAIANVTFI